MPLEVIANLKPRHSVRSASEHPKDIIGNRITQGIAENKTRRSVAVLPHGESRTQVRGAQTPAAFT